MDVTARAGTALVTLDDHAQVSCRALLTPLSPASCLSFPSSTSPPQTFDDHAQTLTVVVTVTATVETLVADGGAAGMEGEETVDGETIPLGAGAAATAVPQYRTETRQVAVEVIQKSGPAPADSLPVALSLTLPPPAPSLTLPPPAPSLAPRHR